MAQWLGCLIPNPRVLTLKPLDDSRTNSAFHPFAFIKWVLGPSGTLVVKSKLSPRSGSVALRQLNTIHKEGHWLDTNGNLLLSWFLHTECHFINPKNNYIQTLWTKISDLNRVNGCLTNKINFWFAETKWPLYKTEFL